jgi:hypothetical protein
MRSSRRKASSNFERKNDFKIIDELAFKLGKEKSSNNLN